jgi:hypothetical protein
MYNNSSNKGRVASNDMQRNANTQKANRTAKGPNNVYADKSGNVSRQTSQGWQSRNSSNGSWGSPSSSSNMNRDAQARQSGASRSSYGGSSYGGSRGGGGGSRGGGGGGRRR